MGSHPVEPPSNVAITRELCKLAHLLEGPQNTDRQALLAAAGFLSVEPPALPEAIAEIAEGMAHSFRGHWVEKRPESWLLAACAKLLPPAG